MGNTLQRFVYTVAGNYRREQARNLLVALAEDIFVVEPDTFLVVETGTGLAALGYVKQTSSSSVKSSCSVPGFQPSSARKLITASGK